LSVRVLYTDVDGTLVGPRGHLFWTSERAPTLAAAQALLRATGEGLEIVAVSGRSRTTMAELGRLLGLDSWFCEMGGIRIYQGGLEAVHDYGAYPGEGPPAPALAGALEVLTAHFPGRLEEHSPWNATREVSLLLRGDLDPAKAGDVLAGEGFAWAELVDNGVLPRRYQSLPGIDLVRAYHLVPRGVTKAAAVAADRHRRGLALEECAMVGDAAADLECRSEVGRCFLVRNGLVKDPDLAWADEPGSGIEVTTAGHTEGFAEVVALLLDAQG
jgi:hydroxymethylpyrimidine pyrophosphatase-like HAD family hydrolase